MKPAVEYAITQALPLLNEFQRREKEAERKISEGDKKITLGREMQAAGLQGIREAERELQEIAQEQQNILTKQFYAIFNGKKELPVEEVSSIFATYLADRSSTVEENDQGKSYGKINSMKGIIRYLDDHKDVKVCNFVSFKTEVCDIPNLAKYLKKSSVRLVGFNNGISAEAKCKLRRSSRCTKWWTESAICALIPIKASLSYLRGLLFRISNFFNKEKDER